MTFGHYVSPLTLAEASFSDLELLVFFVGHTWIWVITFHDSHLQRPLSLTWNWSCSSSFWQGLWYGYIFDVNGRADHKQDVCQFLEVVGVHGRSNTPKIEPKTRHAPPLEPQALEDDRHCSLDLQLQITRSNKTWPHVTFVYCVSAFTLAKASFVWLGMFTTWLPLRFKIHPTKRLKKRAARTEIASTSFWMSGASIGVRGLLDTTQPTVKMCDK